MSEWRTTRAPRNTRQCLSEMVVLQLHLDKNEAPGRPRISTKALVVGNTPRAQPKTVALIDVISENGGRDRRLRALGNTASGAAPESMRQSAHMSS